MSKRIVLTLGQLGLIPIVALGISNAEPWWVLVGLGMWFLFACVGLSVTYHRLLSHRAFKAPRWFRVVGSVLGSVGFLLSPVEWTGQHEDHHKFVDAEGDPHAPGVHGFRVLLYAFHAEGKPGIATARVMVDPDMALLHRLFWYVLGVWIALCALVAGWQGVVFLWAMPCLLTLWSGIAGVFMHADGRAIDRGWLSALVTMGEHRHAAHHENARQWEGDWPASWVIRAVRERD